MLSKLFSKKGKNKGGADNQTKALQQIEVLNKKIYDTTFDTIPNGNHGIALKNIRKRLEIAYPSMTNIYIKNDGEFTSSIIEIEIDEEEMTC